MLYQDHLSIKTVFVFLSAIVILFVSWNCICCFAQLRMYQDKLAQLKKQLQALQEGTLPEYIKRLKKIDQQYKERLRLNELWRDIEVLYYE